jgi:hypothetical protein
MTLDKFEEADRDKIYAAETLIAHTLEDRIEHHS